MFDRGVTTNLLGSVIGHIAVPDMATYGDSVGRPPFPVDRPEKTPTGAGRPGGKPG